MTTKREFRFNLAEVLVINADADTDANYPPLLNDKWIGIK